MIVKIIQTLYSKKSKYKLRNSNKHLLVEIIITGSYRLGSK